jgi:F-type H+-transporting ATPase subunit epsilon
MATPFTFEIVTPDKMLFDSDEVTYVGFRTLLGGMGVKANHLPVIATLDLAPLKIQLANGTEEVFAVCGGFLEMQNNKCTVLATIAEPGDDIDAARANAAKERATARLAAKNEDLDVDRAKYALKKAMMRLRVTEALGKK